MRAAFFMSQSNLRFLLFCFFIHPINIGHDLSNRPVKLWRDLPIKFQRHEHIDQCFVLIDRYRILLGNSHDVFCHMAATFGNNTRCRILLHIVFKRNSLRIRIWIRLRLRSPRSASSCHVSHLPSCSIHDILPLVPSWRAAEPKAHPPTHSTYYNAIVQVLP